MGDVHLRYTFLRYTVLITILGQGYHGCGEVSRASASNNLHIFVLVGFATSIIWTWIVNNAKGSILIANLLHSASNANTALILKLLPVSSPAVFQEGTFLIYGEIGRASCRERV